MRADDPHVNRSDDFEPRIAVSHDATTGEPDVLTNAVQALALRNCT